MEEQQIERVLESENSVTEQDFRVEADENGFVTRVFLRDMELN